MPFPENKILKQTPWLMLPWMSAALVWFGSDVLVPLQMLSCILMALAEAILAESPLAQQLLVSRLTEFGTEWFMLNAIWDRLPTIWQNFMAWSWHASCCSHCFLVSTWWIELLPGGWLLTGVFEP